jgi:aminopeptidase
MADPRLEKLANILVNFSTKVKPGDWVWISANVLALPLVKETIRHILQAGGQYNVLLDQDDLTEITLSESTIDQLQWISPIEKILYEKADVLIALRAASNTRYLSGIDPAKTRARQQARRDLTQTYLQRSAEGSLRWVLSVYPCQAYSQEADMSLREYEDFVYQATFADQPDPVRLWQEMHINQQRLVEWMKGKKEVVVRGPNVDLRLSVEGRTFINDFGDKNMPGGEVFTGPVENSLAGWVKYTYPAIYNGREVEGIELEFEEGRVVSSKAKKNEEFLNAMLDSDEGARYVGEFAIGTNFGIQRFTKNILFDEKIGGSIHMALGSGYPQTGSLNQSSIHWDMLCDMRKDSEIRVDGELIYKDGQILV